MEKRKVIIDCDPGIDDAFALVAALSAKDIEILGITTVAGNKGLDATTKNALRLKGLMNSPVKVYAGKESQISDHLDASEFHGADGMGNSGLPYDLSLLGKETASDFILEMVRQYPDEIDLITLGPLTTISQAMIKDYEAMKQLKGIYMMGGGLHRGNVTPYAEFNFYFDAQATADVIDKLADYADIHIMTLDASHQTLLTPNDMFFFSQEGGKVGEVLNHIYQPYLKSYYTINKYIGAVIHDLLLVQYYLDPTLSTDTKRENLMIITEGDRIGQTVIDDKGKAVTLVLGMNNVDWKNEFCALVFPEAYDKWKTVSNQSK